MDLEDGAFYEGHFKNGEKSGYGIQKWKDGSYYKGDWQANEFNGKGEFVWATEHRYNKYVGGWLNNMMHDYGEMIYKDGGEFKG